MHQTQWLPPIVFHFRMTRQRRGVRQGPLTRLDWAANPPENLLHQFIGPVPTQGDKNRSNWAVKQLVQTSDPETSSFYGLHSENNILCCCQHIPTGFQIFPYVHFFLAHLVSHTIISFQHASSVGVKDKKAKTKLQHNLLLRYQFASRMEFNCFLWLPLFPICRLHHPLGLFYHIFLH